VIFGAQDVRDQFGLAVVAVNKPTEMPATGLVIGMPASMRARVPHTEAMELEPLEPMISETRRTA
jgi:hypothetical protein